MGLLTSNAANKGVSGDASNGKPFWAPSATYQGHVQSVSLSTSTVGTYKVHRILWVIDVSRLPGAPNPLEWPMVTQDLDPNIREEADILFGILGTPHRAENGTIVWDESGLIRWNGRTETEGKFVGKADLKIKADEPRPKNQGGGWWSARYRIEDISPPGSAASEALESAEALADFAEAAKGEGASPHDNGHDDVDSAMKAQAKRPTQQSRRSK